MSRTRKRVRVNEEEVDNLRGMNRKERRFLRAKTKDGRNLRGKTPPFNKRQETLREYLERTKPKLDTTGEAVLDVLANE